MLKALKFVQGAVVSKGFAPELTHFSIQDGVIKGFNGALALASPIDLDINATPKAIPFVKAIIACKAATAMHMTPAGRLAVKSGKFKAFVDCSPDVYPDIKPEGEFIELNGAFIATLKILQPFMAEDASRPWARGVLLDGQTATATNNIIIVQKWMAEPFPLRVNIPAGAVKELVRIKEEPTRIQMTANSMTFHYEDGRWLRTNLIDLDWPDINKVLDRDANPVALPNDFYEGLESILPFVDDICRIYLGEGLLRTSQVEGEGASVAFPEFTHESIFNGKMFAQLETVMTTIDLTCYPSPCIFYGAELRGAIIGVRPA